MNWEAVLSHCREYGVTIGDYNVEEFVPDEVLKKTDKLLDYNNKLANHGESDHEGRTYYYKKETSSLTTGELFDILYDCGPIRVTRTN